LFVSQNAEFAGDRRTPRRRRLEAYAAVGGPSGPRSVTLAEVMVQVWQQSLVDGAVEVEVDGRRHRVDRTRRQGLRFVTFSYDEFAIEGIEQNPEKASRWAKLAQDGKRIMQFRVRGRYVANVCEGTLMRYPGWKTQGLPD
jgi:hypothetical protein